jgi:hypothetical protein
MCSLAAQRRGSSRLRRLGSSSRLLSKDALSPNPNPNSSSRGTSIAAAAATQEGRGPKVPTHRLLGPVVSSARADRVVSNAKSAKSQIL